MDSMPVSGGNPGAQSGPGWRMPDRPIPGFDYSNQSVPRPSLGVNDLAQGQQQPYYSSGYQSQQQPPQASPGQGGRNTQFYRDVFGNMATAAPGLAGRQAQWGPNHTIGRYDQQGVWNPLAEQNTANGVAGRSWGAGAGGVHPGFGGGQQQAAWQAGPMMSAQDAYAQAQQSGDQRGALMAQAQMNGPQGNMNPAVNAAWQNAAQTGNWGAVQQAAKQGPQVVPGSTRTVPRRIG